MPRDDILSKFDLGARHPALDSLRRAYATLHLSQRAPLEERSQKQLQLASVLVRHAKDNVPLYRDLYRDVEEIRSWEDFRAVPILTRDLASQAPLEDRTAEKSAPDSAPVEMVETSGTTGKKVTVLRSTRTEVWRSACKLLEYDWMGLDPRRSCASIRFDVGPKVRGYDSRLNCVVTNSWEEPLLGRLLPVGRGYVFRVGSKETLVADTLREVRPEYISATPTMLESLSSALDGPMFEIAMTIGETLYEPVRERLASHFGCRIFDTYGTREIGRIAVECPDTRNYHVHDYNVIVEILDDHGKPVNPGETGHVVLTSLHNLATPMIRYKLGDLATLGGRCPCGRTMTTIERLEGREVSRVVLRDGRKRLARHVSKALQDVEGFGPFLLRQKDYNVFELVVEEGSRGTQKDFEEARRGLSDLVEEPVTLTVTRVASLPPLPSGKRTRFVIDFTPEA